MKGRSLSLKKIITKKQILRKFFQRSHPISPKVETHQGHLAGLTLLFEAGYEAFDLPQI
jgi:hypothetical protein